MSSSERPAVSAAGPIVRQRARASTGGRRRADDGAADRLAASSARAREAELLAARLRVQRHEIEAAIVARVRDGVPDPAGRDDGEYLQGLLDAIGAALDYGLDGLADATTMAVPAAAMAQARRAARVGVGLDTVLRRYLAGYALLEGFVVREAERASLAEPGHVLRQMLETQAVLLDRLIPAITGAYLQERFEGAGPLPLAPTGTRARACLAFLAAQSQRGASPSNREIARAIGVLHESQISRLLAMLAEHGLVEKRTAGVGRRNAWRLTRAGEQAAMELYAPYPQGRHLPANRTPA